MIDAINWTPRRLTRTEHAACELALGVLRRGVAEYGLGYEWLRGAASRHVHDAAMVLTYARHEDSDALIDFGRGHVPARAMRARLVLYLRALLRGTERAWWYVEASGETDWDGGALTLAVATRIAARHGGSVRQVRPLWQLAPTHGEREGGA